MLGSNSDLSEGILVFQGTLNQSRADEVVRQLQDAYGSFGYQTSYLIPDNSVLNAGGFVSLTERQCFGREAPVSSAVMERLRWREVLTGATVGAVVGGCIGSVIPVAGTATGAVIGGAIGGAMLGGGLAYTVDVEEDPDNLEDNILSSALCGVIGGAAGGIVGGIIGGGGLLPPPGGGTSGGGPTSPFAKDWKYLRVGD